VSCETVADPSLRAPTDAIVRVDLSGICGSDLHVYHERERGLDRGTVMGHEFVGEIVETGSAVRARKRGERVLSPFSTSCGRCFFCKGGLTSRCASGQLFGWVEGGEGLHGAQAELVRVPLADATLLPMPEDVTAEEALLLGDVLSTGYYCARQAGVNADGVYAVVGCGPVGLMAIVGARELGASKIIAVDSIAERLDLARSFGAVPIDYKSQDPREPILELTEGRGADAVLEVVGNAAAHRLAFDLVRAGGTISVVGVHNEAEFAFDPAEAYAKNLTYRVGRCPARHLMNELIPMVQAKRYDLASIVSHRMPLERAADGYRLFDAKTDGCTKIVLARS
jgi:threonine dehydrogenase-like Zn-dependent dehydrogenase